MGFLFYYFLIGLIIAILLEIMISSNEVELKNGERISMIILWPLMILTFLYGIFNPHDDDIPKY